MIILLILNLPFAPMWAMLLRVPKEYLYAGITVFAAFGVYAAGASVIDLAVMIAIGLLGFVMRQYDVPLAPVLIALILGPLAEYSLRDAMANSQNNPAVLVSSPITIGLYVVLVAGVIWNGYRRVQEKKLAAELQAAEEAALKEAETVRSGRNRGRLPAAGREPFRGWVATTSPSPCRS
ncbi:MAG: tripartite tricarboxylate transporter permease [Micropruina sp.]